MKKIIFTITAAGFMLATILSGCNSPSKKVENAQENLEEARQELSQAQRDSVADFELFKKESEERINNNDKLIAAFKERMATDKKQIKEEDQKIIDNLEQKNINMRKKIEEYKENGKDKWEAFKVEFNHDMDELADALKGLTVKNTK
ncbi:MAG: hypothetical protein Q8M15_00555 [Bacteroidota bacterium]|nr:hypothetical protein [Bacteroidota bacterium]